MSKRQHTIDLRDWEVEKAAAESRAKLDLSQWQLEEEQPQPNQVLDLRPQGAEQFYEHVPEAVQPTQAYLGVDPPAQKRPRRISRGTAMAILIPMVAGGLITAQLARSGNVTDDPQFKEGQSSSRNESKPTSAQSEPAPANTSTAPQTAPAVNSGTTSGGTGAGSSGGSSGSSGASGTGGGSLDPALDVCLAIPGSTVCQGAAVDPTASDPVRVDSLGL
jgi:hypothetical protein